MADTATPAFGLIGTLPDPVRAAMATIAAHLMGASMPMATLTAGLALPVKDTRLFCNVVLVVHVDPVPMGQA